MKPITTANGIPFARRIVCDPKQKSKTIIEHAQAMQSTLEKEFGWETRQWPPESAQTPGRWTTDINVCRIAAAVSFCTKSSTIEAIAAMVHEGWRSCYWFWKTNKPWLWRAEDKYLGESWLYERPCKPFRDEDVRAKRFNCWFDQLSGIDRRHSLAMARYIRDNCL